MAVWVTVEDGGSVLHHAEVFFLFCQPLREVVVAQGRPVVLVESIGGEVEHDVLPLPRLPLLDEASLLARDCGNSSYDPRIKLVSVVSVLNLCGDKTGDVFHQIAVLSRS